MINYYDLKIGDQIIDPRDGETIKKVTNIDKLRDYWNLYFEDGTFTRIATGKHHATKLETPQPPPIFEQLAAILNSPIDLD